MSKLKLLRKVEFDLEQDEVSGIWGLMPRDCKAGEFNAFTDGIGIFHDIFEHYFEEKYPRFSGASSYSTLGEVAALGHALAFKDLGVNSRETKRSIYTLEDSLMFDIEELCRQTAEDSTVYKGTDVPFSYYSLSKVDHLFEGWYILEQLDVLKLRLKEMFPDKSAKEFKDILNVSKAKQAFIWGYVQVAKFYNADHSYDLSEFITEWMKFTESIKWEYIADFIESVYITVEFDKTRIFWTATFNRHTESYYNEDDEEEYYEEKIIITNKSKNSIQYQFNAVSY